MTASAQTAGTGGRPAMRGNGTFCTGDEFESFLSEIGAAPDGFIAPNFLIDEGVLSERASSYRDSGAGRRHRAVADWQVAHDAYLEGSVFLKSGGDGPPALLDLDDVDLCPETFRRLDPGSPYLGSDPGLDLIRVDTLQFIARRAGETESGLRALAVEALRSSAGHDGRRLLDDVLAAWSLQIDLRPVFSAYWEDVDDLLPDDDEPKEWADKLRDRLGLAHLDPAVRGGPIDILVFRYQVKALPGILHRRRERPLVPPTVLDGKQSMAFCPAPRGSATGHTIDLGADSVLPRREMLHPAITFQADHLLRVGTVRRAVNPALFSAARGIHLDELRKLAGRSDYAADTDGDLK